MIISPAVREVRKNVRSEEDGPDELIRRYGEKRDDLGSGTFGEVWSTEKGYAVKKNYGEWSQSILLEVGLMQNLRSKYLMNLIDAFVEGDHIFLVMPLGKNLADTINPEDVQQLFYEVSRGVADLHVSDVIHCDIKPQNCIDLGDRVVISDFGLSVFQTCNPKPAKDAFAALYRPPEIFLGEGPGKPSDVWALGAMLYEWLTGERAFNGDSDLEILLKILRVFGSPTEADWPGVSKLKEYRDWMRLYTPNSKKFFSRISNPEARDLLEKILVPNPNRRLTIFEILQHPYVTGSEVEPLQFELSDPTTCFENLRFFMPDGLEFPPTTIAGLETPSDYQGFEFPLQGVQAKPWIFYVVFSWMTEVRRKFRLRESTLDAAIIMLIWVAKNSVIAGPKVQLVCLSCLSIACDIHEGYQPELEDFEWVAGGNFTVDEIKETKDVVLRKIGFRTVFTSPVAISDFRFHQTPSSFEEHQKYSKVVDVLLGSPAPLIFPIEELGELIFKTYQEFSQTGVISKKTQDIIRKGFSERPASQPKIGDLERSFLETNEEQN